MLPLAAEVNYEQGLPIVHSLLERSGEVASSFQNVGRGIGAIMLLIVVFYYISSILDGGKFQIKMLIPFLIFLFVCNFSWIRVPVVSFTETLSHSLIDCCNDKKAEIKEKYGCRESATFQDMYNSMHQDEGGEADKIINDAIKDEGDSNSADSQTSSTEEDTPVTKGIFGKIHYHVKKGIGDAATKGSMNLQHEMSTQGIDIDGSGEGFKPSVANLLFTSLFSSIISYICALMGYVMMAFGGIMTAIIVAFGPITFAFAIFPGQGGTIKSWFIRLCQFSLWMPLCALVDCFSTAIFDMMATANSGIAVLMTIAVAICDLVALTSVPSIASMIIEGAQGAVSLSQGLQSMGSALSRAGALAGSMVTLTAGKDNAVSRSVAGLKQQGLIGFGKQVGSYSSAGSQNPWTDALKRNQVIGRNAMKGK